MKKNSCIEKRSLRILFSLMLGIYVLVAMEIHANDGQNTIRLQSDSKSTCYAVDRSRPEWIGESTSVPDGEEEQDSILPTRFSLDQNYPNPFNPETTIAFAVKEKCRVVLKVFDVLGREAVTLVDEEYAPGFHDVTFDASRFSTGMYFYQIRMKDFIDVKKMLLME